jgi:hypothetical protein
MGQPFDVVGYTFRADVICPDCIVEAVAKAEADNPLVFNPAEDTALRVPAGLTAGQGLAILAYRLGVDRTAEHTFDSDNFPKVVFRDQVGEAEGFLDTCGACGEALAD